MLVPAELGGEGARAADVADVCAILGRACASTAMIFAMHQVKLACLARHARGVPGSSLSCARSPSVNCCSPPRPPRAPTAATSARATRRCARRRPRFAAARRLLHLLRPRGRRARHHGAPRARARRNPIRCSSSSAVRTTRSSRPRPGTRSACAALAASASFFAPRAGPTRCWPNPTTASTARPWRPTRICSGARHGAASPPAPSPAPAPSSARRRARPAAACRPPPRSSPRARLSLETLRGAVQAGLANFERHAADPGGLADHGSAARADLAQGRGLRARGGDGDDRDARLRPCRLSQRQPIRDGPLPARHPLGADHDQQRPHSRQRRTRGADERGRRPR